MAPLFTRFDHFVGHAEHRIVAEADQDGLFRSDVLVEARRGQRGLDNRREIASRADVGHAGPGDQARW